MNDVLPWSRRAAEEAALFCPPFMAAVLHHAIRDFEQEAGQKMPFPLAFLVPPVVLASTTRSILPNRKDSSLAAWLQAHPTARLHFGDIAASMVPAIREGILFGIAKDALVSVGDRLEAKPLRRGFGGVINSTTPEVIEIFNKARFVGRWYANAGTIETIMVLWGVRP